MTDAPKISVLIPVYNGGTYLKQLIENLKSQTLTDFEAVFVDDSSTDGSAALLQNEAEQDGRFKIVHRAQKGGTAVKGIVYGLPYCVGQYLFYMSQDDLIENDTLEKLYNTAVETNADIVVPDMEWFYDDGADHGGIRYAGENVINGREAFLRSIDFGIHGFYLRKMDLAKKIGWDDLYYNSCEYATRVHLFYADKVAFCQTKFFYRQNNQNAITKSPMKPFKIEVLFTDLRLIRFMLDNKIRGKKLKLAFKIAFSEFQKYSSFAVFTDFSKKESEQARAMFRTIKWNLLLLALKSGNPKLLFKSLPLLFKRVGKTDLKTSLMYLKWKMLNGMKVYKKDKGRKKREFYRLRSKLCKAGVLPQGGLECDFYATTEAARRLNCTVGFGTYCGDNVVVGDNRTTIGKFCSIAANVIIGASEHPLNYLSTSPFFYNEALGFSKGTCEIYLKPVHVGNDVWICDNVFIKGGVTIGDGAVLAAGAVVTKDVPPYAVVAGVPAKVLKYRFAPDIVQKLLELKWWNLPIEEIRQLPFKNIEKCFEIAEHAKTMD